MAITWINIPRTEKDAVEFFQQKGLLPRSAKCNHGHSMKLTFSEGVKWRCDRATCRTRKTIRKGTWFESTKIDFVTALHFIYAWSEEMTSLRWSEKHLKLNKLAVIKWNARLREVCAKVLRKREPKIGGIGKTVEIDEILFSKGEDSKRRYSTPQWIFGGVCRETKECFLIRVQSLSSSVLMEAIVNNIKPGTTIVSDSCKAYPTVALQREGFHHLNVNHGENFIDPITGMHTLQKFERLWANLKCHHKKMRGIARSMLKSHLLEFVWRRLHDDAFEDILSDIARLYPTF